MPAPTDPSTPLPDAGSVAGATPAADALSQALRQGRRAAAGDVEALVEGVLAGGVDLEAFGRWLVACADAGETVAEIAGVAAALRGRMVRIAHTLPVVADTCGTGGDGSGSFNISTAAAIVVAGAGLPVAKHGNRAVSSRTGSADVLERLGVKVDGPAEVAARCLTETGLCFCLAPTHHPAMARIGPLRRSLGRPTVFNLVGPLCNPAGATVQVIGVGRAAVGESVAEAAVRGGAKRVLVVCGWLDEEPSSKLDPASSPRLDEISLFGPTDVIDVTSESIRRLRITPEDFGIATRPASDLSALAVAGPEESAEAIRAILAGAPGPGREVVVLNAAALLWAAGLAESLPAARVLAERSIDCGAAAAKLATLVTRSHALLPG